MAIAQACLDDETVLGFLEGRLRPDELAGVESHTLTCVACQELVSAGLAARSVRVGEELGGDAMATAELSCRFLVPLLHLASRQIPPGDVAGFLSSWRTDAQALSDESGWVTRRFCEALVEWLAARVGVDAIIDVTLRESYSPETMGILYPFIRAFGSPAVGYARLPSFARLLNRASDIRVRMRGRNRAIITYRPKTEATRERSPLICEVRRAQIAAGPTVWGLPLAVVEEAECQAHGGDCCVYQATWAEPTRWWKAAFWGAVVAALAWFSSRHNWLTSAMATAAAVTGIHLWGARRDLRDQRALADLKMDMLGRIQRLRRSTAPLDREAAQNGASALASASPPDGRTRVPEIKIAPLPQSGQLLAGRYRLGPLLGAGGMGLVFSATDEATDQAIALKVLRPELSVDPRWVTRMEREVRIARIIEDPHVCQVRSFGAIDGYCFLTMELAKRTLHDELRSGAVTADWRQRMADAHAIVLGLAAIHRARIVHRDLTPQNVLRFSGDRLAIADFGLAIDRPGATTILAGTPSRIAPEVLKGAKSSYASDVWQLGMILQDVLYGRGVTADEIGGDSPAASADDHVSSAIRETLRQLCIACTNDDPARRPQDAQAVSNLFPTIA
jgi:hypothetical protein